MDATVDQQQGRLGVRIGKLATRIVNVFFVRRSKIATTPFIDNATFPWVSSLEAKADAIRAEMHRVMVRLDDIPTFHQMSPDQVRISKGDNWKIFAFQVYGHRIEHNRLLCPETAKALDALPDLQNAWFSILAPGYQIPRHRGATNAVVRCHLGLAIPARAEDCWIRVGDEVRCWRYGRCMLFDDTYEHEVHNNTDEPRVVLFLDVNRPLDRVGELVRQLMLVLIRTSAYVRRPLQNLERWNQRIQARKGIADA